jgi:hypothetical protein
VRATSTDSTGTSIWNSTSSPNIRRIWYMVAASASVNGRTWRTGPDGPKVNRARSRSPGMPTRKRGPAGDCGPISARRVSNSGMAARAAAAIPRSSAAP